MYVLNTTSPIIVNFSFQQHFFQIARSRSPVQIGSGGRTECGSMRIRLRNTAENHTPTPETKLFPFPRYVNILTPHAPSLPIFLSFLHIFYFITAINPPFLFLSHFSHVALFIFCANPSYYWKVVHSAIPAAYP